MKKNLNNVLLLHEFIEQIVKQNSVFISMCLSVHLSINPECCRGDSLAPEAAGNIWSFKKKCREHLEKLHPASSGFCGGAHSDEIGKFLFCVFIFLLEMKKKSLNES